MSPAPSDEPTRIAIIGTGLAGLTAAYLLQTSEFTHGEGGKARVEVHLFEKADELGMDAASLTVKTAEGTFRVDAPMRSINRGSHSRVNKLYEKVGVKLKRLDFGYAFTRLSDRPDEDAPPAYAAAEAAPKELRSRGSSSAKVQQTTQFIYEGESGLKWPPLGVPAHLHPTWSNPSPLPLLTNIVQLLLLALSYIYLISLSYFYVSAGLTDVVPRSDRWSAFVRRWISPVGDESLRDWASRHGLWRVMRDEVLVPLWAAVCTVDKRTAEEMPVGEVLQYLVATFGTEHYVARDGVRSIVRALAAPVPLAQIHTSSTLAALAGETCPDGSKRVVLHSDATETEPLTFDHVILATQANQARTLLSTWTGPSHETLSFARLDALSKFSYKKSLVVTHSDSALLPPSKSDHRDLTFASHARSDWPAEEPLEEGTEEARPKGWIQATHLISTSPLIMQTTNPCYAPSPEQTYRSTWFERAVVTQASRRALPSFLLPDEEERRSEREGRGEGMLQGVDNVWLVGSWAAEGCPLLEGCVSSAERVVSELARREGWRQRV